MVSFNPLRRPNGNPERGAGSAGQLESRVQSMTQTQLDRLLQRLERGGHAVSEQHLGIIEDRLKQLEAQSTDHLQHQQIVVRSQARLDVLRKRLSEGGAPASSESDEQENHGTGTATRVGVGFGGTILGILGIRSIRHHGLFGSRDAAGNRTSRGILGGSLNASRSGVNLAARHPIMAAFLGYSTVRLGREAAQYLSLNSDGLIKQIEEEARASGIDPIRHAEERGRSLADTIRGIGSNTIDAVIQGLVSLFHGKIDPETGAISLPYATLRPAFIVAWQAGLRRKGGPAWFNKLTGLVVESKPNAILREARVAGAMAGSQPRVLALEMNKLYTEMNSGASMSRITDIEKRLKEITKELKADGRVNLKPGETFKYGDKDGVKRINEITREAERLHHQERVDFDQHRLAIEKHLADAEKNIRNGNTSGMTAEKYKQAVLGELDIKVKAYENDLRQRKLTVGDEFRRAVDFHAKGNLDRIGGGYVNATVEKMEKFGYGFKERVPGAGLAWKGLVGYSCLPIALESASYLNNVFSGDQTLSMLQQKRANGVALTSAETLELKRLEGQGTALRNDLVQLGVGFIPGGGLMDLKLAFDGEDLNKRKLSTEARVAMGIMGGLDVASLALAPLTGGLSIVGFKGLRAIFASRKVATAAEVVKQAERLKAVTTVTNAQRTAQKLRETVFLAQRGAQAVIYTQLGVQVVFSSKELLEKGSEKLAAAREGAATFVENTTNAVTSRIPGHRPAGQTPAESGHAETA